MNVQNIGRGGKPVPVMHIPEKGGITVGTPRSCGKLVKARGLFTRSSPLMMKISPISTQRRNSSGELSENVILPPIKVSKIFTSAACATRRGSQRQVSRARPESKQYRSSPGQENVLNRSPRQDWYLQKDARSQYFLDNPIVKPAIESLKNGKTDKAGITSHVRVIKRANVKQSRYAHPLPPSAKKHTPGQSHTSSSEIEERKLDTDSSVKTRQKPSSSNDSAIETESVSENAEGLENEHETQRSPEEEYYTNQRIAEWVLKVNGSLFSLTPDPDINNSVKEQDTAIKIVYDGD
ncbi:UNVERIFIED_CONTAM: hypothetical protein FKN15_026345 [Acipenser sinensis]